MQFKTKPPHHKHEPPLKEGIKIIIILPTTMNLDKHNETLFLTADKPPMEISTLPQSTMFYIFLFCFVLFCFQIELDRRKGRMKLLTDVPFTRGSFLGGAKEGTGRLN